MRLWLAMMVVVAAITAAVWVPSAAHACPQGYERCGQNGEFCC